MDSSALPLAEPAVEPAPVHPDDEKHSSIADHADTQLAREAHVGQRPGTLTIRPGSLRPRLFMMSYDEDSHTEREYADYQELWTFFSAHPELRHWIDVRGYDDLPLMEQFMRDFELHPLQMEDVLGDYQRAKVDVFGDNRLFLVSRMTEFSKLFEIDDDQFSIFTGTNYVLTFQDDYEDCLDPVRNRLRSGYSQIKRKPPLYLAYALTDVVLDQYYPTMAAIGDYIERLEDRILQDRPDRRVLGRILRMKKDIIRFRRFVYPEREKIAEILRMPEDIVPDDMKVYFRDCYDHAIQALDLAESYRESVSSLVDLFMSNQNNRMNEVMKVLTIISSIFIPLSFVVGLYGMNFQRENPHGGINYLNMPELYSPWGYPVLLGILAGIVVVQLVYFYRKGWLTNR
ncbi:magnesium/cobalt transporter CorA [Hymenobacter psychrotolerans]|uniref:Magnesium transport protein CorA n=1 Tax=Hymenobacter psychrotolerans DSM 18569 TaxID=1121959 RepID=A0A1M6T1E3_9BACT|nr:magnesium/cobalt transporter CorA [Hymenobacter psychrotolerans]SHK50739.1 magnesium transporter [Hymenobacter psychrotolerans DSM 18569]